MNRKKWVLSLIAAIIIQIATYYYIGIPQLRYRLLAPDFTSLVHQSVDSAFIQDLYVSDCTTGDNNIYISHNLRETLPQLPKLLQAKHLHFQERSKFSWNKQPENRYNLQYYTWAKRRSWLTLFSFFQATQEELLIFNRKQCYSRRVTYRWLLFTWVKTFEVLESWERPIPIDTRL